MDVNCEVLEPSIFAATVADEIIACINDTLSEKPFCSLFLAGGKTPASVYRSLVNPSRISGVEWNRVKLFLGDERWVEPGDSRLNSKMVRETLLSKFTDAEQVPHFFPIETSLPTLEAGVEAFSDTIKAEVLKGDGVPQVDVLLLGLGTDGHTASLFPGDPQLADFEKGKREVLCLAAYNPEDETDRISVSPLLIANAQRVFFLVTGETKASMVKKALEEEASLVEMPAQIHRKCNGRVVWFIDSPAAKLIPQN